MITLEAGVHLQRKREPPIFIENQLRFEAGDVVGVIGPSGIGKTTLLEVLGALLRPATGQVRMEIPGVPAFTWASSPVPKERARVEHYRARVGFVFQDARLVPTQTGLWNVLGIPWLHGATRKEMERLRDRVYADAARLGLGEGAGSGDVAGPCGFDLGHPFGICRHDRAGAPPLAKVPHQLSAGEKRRISVLRALAGSPCIVFADEPTVGVESSVGLAVMNVLGAWHRGEAGSHGCDKGGRLLVFASHDESVVSRYATRCVLLGRKGESVRVTEQACPKGRGRSG